MQKMAKKMYVKAEVAAFISKHSSKATCSPICNVSQLKRSETTANGKKNVSSNAMQEN